MKTIAVVEARRHFARLLEAVESGEEVVITRRGRSIARLVPERQRTAADIFRPFWQGEALDIDSPPDLPADPVDWS